MDMTADLNTQIMADTVWLTGQQDLTAARLAYLLREKGIEVKAVLCAKVFPDIKDPTSGVLIVPHGQVIQFAFNRAGMIVEAARIDEWINITQTYMDHPWRDEILTALGIFEKRGQEAL
jgi:hypothetical protein